MELCEPRTVPKDLIFFFKEFQGDSTATNEKQRTLEWTENVRQRLNALAATESGSEEEKDDQAWPEAPTQLANKTAGLLSTFGETKNVVFIDQLLSILRDPQWRLQLPAQYDITCGYVDMFVAQTPSFGEHLVEFLAEANARWPALLLEEDTIRAVWRGVQSLGPNDRIFHHHEVYGILSGARFQNISSTEMPDALSARVRDLIRFVRATTLAPDVEDQTSGSEMSTKNLPPTDMLMEAVSGTLSDLVLYNQRVMKRLESEFGPEDTVLSLDACIERFSNAPDVDTAKTCMKAIGRYVLKALQERDGGIGVQVEKLHSLLKEVSAAKAKKKSKAVERS